MISYTLIMTDPGVLDPESTKTNAWQWGHWVVTNIPGELSYHYSSQQKD